MRPLEMVSKFKILPRDLRLLKTRGANIAVRPDYFLFRLPPFTGCVRRDSCLLLTDGPSAATDVLQDSLLSQIKLPTEEDQLQTTPFELRVLETALREDLLSKQERFTPNPNPNPDPNPDANPDPDPDPNPGLGSQLLAWRLRFHSQPRNASLSSRLRRAHSLS